MKIRAVIMAGGEGTRLKTLTVKRAKPAVPFAGKYRMIDFPLSNCVNSGIFDVLVLTQYRPHSLNDHIGRGRPWDLDRSFSGGIYLLQPYKGQFDTDWYAGTADAVYQNLNVVRRGNPDYIIILSGDHVYEMDYRKLVNFHVQNQAEATVCTIPVPIHEASRYGIVDVEDDYRVRAFVEKPPEPPGNLANMGVYVFNLDVLEAMLIEDHKRRSSDHDFGKNVLPAMVQKGQAIYAYPYDGYWIDVGTLDSYWEAHMDLLESPPALDLNDRTWVIHTRSEERPPVQILAGATVIDSMITDGSVISPGAVVERSVLSPGVFVGPNAAVRDSIILTDTYISAGAVVERCVIDKVCVIGENARVGSKAGGDGLGLTLIGKSTHIPAGYTVGRNCMLRADLGPEDFAQFADQKVPDGTELDYDEKRRKRD